MIFSIHIPKTAGSSFRKALAARYGSRLALYYGPRDPKTTDVARVAPEDLAARLPALRDAGIEVLHGHFQPRLVEEAARAPENELWTWLRDPVERTLSHYAFYGDKQRNRLGERIRTGEITPERFVDVIKIRDYQSEYLKDFTLDDFAFVGITERFELGLALLFGADAPRLPRRYNATDDKPVFDEDTRARLAALNPRDYALYAEGLRINLDRLAAAGPIEAPERPKAGGSGLLKRLIRKVS